MFDEMKIEKIKNWLAAGSINVFGLPLSGKDTQCSVLADLFGGEVVSSGKILRQRWLGYENNRGKLAPAKEFIDMVLPYLEDPKLTGKPLILSSIGRLPGEEQAVVDKLEQTRHPLKSVILLNISEDDAYNRLRHDTYNNRGNRPDDTPETLRTIIDEYNTNTVHALDYYRNRGLLIGVDGTGTRDEVTALIIESLYKKLQ